MTEGAGTLRASLLARSIREPQHRDTFYLTLNTLLGAGTGLLFWVLLVRLVGVPPEDIGVGFAVIGLGTICGVIGKGGLDTALLRSVPIAGRIEGLRLLRFAVLVGASVSTVLAAALVVASHLWGALPPLSWTGWSLVAAIGILLVVTWLQDAHFLAEGSARPTFRRNVVFSAARLVLPIPIVWLALQEPVPMAWAAALLVSAVVARFLADGDRFRTGLAVPRGEFLLSSMRNITGSTAEFLPGLVLAPMVMALEGAEAAAYFGIAWTGAALLYLITAAIGRSALATMVRTGQGHAAAVRRAVRQTLLLVAPPLVVAVAFAPFILAVIGPEYAAGGASLFVVLCLATIFIAPSYLYLALLRARERTAPLVAFPAAMVFALFLFTPLFGARFGDMGVAYAWLLANVPFGLYAAYRLYQEGRGVMDRAETPTHDGRAHLE